MPPELFLIDPWWKNFFWNMATVQFDHRLTAYALAIVVPLLWWKVRAFANPIVGTYQEVVQCPVAQIRTCRMLNGFSF